MAVKNNLALIFKYLKLNLKKEAQYKTSFIMQIVMMILNNCFFMIQLVIIFSVTDSIGGYGFNEMLILFGVSAGSFGVAHLFFNGAFNIGELIYNGKLDVYLTQPKNLLINICSSSTSVSAIGDILYCFIALIIAGATWWWYLAMIPLIIIGGIIYAGTIVCFQTLAFYFKRGSSVADMISSAITMFGIYPPIIFSFATKLILYTLIPCGFIVFVPVESVLLSFNVWWFLGMIGFAIVVVALAFLLFRLGLKRYSSENLMSGRL